MQVVRFYCEAQSQPPGRLFGLIVQASLRLLLKMWTIEHFAASTELCKLHLLYLPVESEFLSKSVLNSPLFMVYLKLAIYNSRPGPSDKVLDEVKLSLEGDIDDILTILTQNDNEAVKAIKFLKFDFLQTLVERLLSEYDVGGQPPEDSFSYRMLSKLITASPAIKEQTIDYFRSANLLPRKINMFFCRLEYIFRGKHYELLEHTRTISQLFAQLNETLQNGYFNQHVQATCQLDPMDDRAHSCHLIRELIQLKSLIRPDEELANHIFEYIAKLTEFYGEAKKGELLVLIPRLVCELFGIVAHKTDNKQSLASSLQTLERTDKPCSCSNYGSPYSQSVFRCLDCEDKRLICHGCVLICHEKHAISFAASSPFGNRHPCQCSAISSNLCKLKKSPSGPTQITKKEPRENFINDFRMFRGRNIGPMGDLPPSMHVQMYALGSMNPMSTIGLHPQIQELGGQSFSQPFRLAEYGNPFDHR